MSEFCTIIARKINKIPEFYTIFARKNARMLCNNCPKIFFPIFFLGGGHLHLPVPCLLRPWLETRQCSQVTPDSVLPNIQCTV